MFFGQQQQAPAMFGGGQISPQLLQTLMMNKGAGGHMSNPQMPMQGMNPVNLPQHGLMPGQMPQMGQGPGSQMNPLASILGNQGGATSPQGGRGMDAGSAGQGQGMGGLMQIINAMKSQQQTNGVQPGQAPGGIDILSIIRAMQAGERPSLSNSVGLPPNVMNLR